jgi:hypothetical protein
LFPIDHTINKPTVIRSLVHENGWKWVTKDNALDELPAIDFTPHTEALKLRIEIQRALLIPIHQVFDRVSAVVICDGAHASLSLSTR